MSVENNIENKMFHITWKSAINIAVILIGVGYSVQSLSSKIIETTNSVNELGAKLEEQNNRIDQLSQKINHKLYHLENTVYKIKNGDRKK